MGKADEHDISDEDYNMCRILVAMGIGVTIVVGAYHIGIALIDAFEGLMYQMVIHGANPFGWS